MALFRFRRFEVDDCGCGQKICSDSVLLGAWFFACHPHAESLLDVGTGSGLLALMGADLTEATQIVGVESEHSAYLAARTNFEASPWASRLKGAKAISESVPAMVVMI